MPAPWNYCLPLFHNFDVTVRGSNLGMEGVAFNCCVICISIIWLNGWHDARNPRHCIISLDMLHFISQCLTMLDYLLG
jgi:hypothetical protein